MISLKTPLKNLPRVGPKYAKLLKKLGLETIQDLLFYYPHRYEDLSKITPIQDLQPEQKVTIQGQIISISNSRSPRKRMTITQAIIADRDKSVGTGQCPVPTNQISANQSQIRVIWFNQPFLSRALGPGKLVNLAGKVKIDNQGLYLSSPSYEFIKQDDPSAKQTVHTGRLVPIYHETYNLSSRYLRYLIKPLLSLTNQIQDWLPRDIKKQEGLLDLDQAIKQIHFPKNQELSQAAKKRLTFNEALLIQLLVLSQKQKIKQQKAHAIEFNLAAAKRFVKSLPFKLTNAQRRAAWEIIQDLKQSHPMNRLLEGDVGSGKTVVAAMAILQTALNDYQTALMAPTEILAQQHFQEISRLLKKFKIKIGLLTSSDSLITGAKIKLSKQKILLKNKKGEINLLIGTHALIQDQVKFKNLGLVIIDEQHRFGVKQRSQLIQCESDTYPIWPHLLSLSATPIPRSLALIIYGDLDLSLLDEMPQGRQRVITQTVIPAARDATYQFIRQEIKKGYQAFVICPRIEKTETIKTIPVKITFWQQNQIEAEIKAVTQEYKKLSKTVFPDLKITMLHGRLKPREKNQIMTDFKLGKIDILISTSVIEVGIDVPNATMMLIEGAERFGLAQLHQFRGRIGRGKHQSYCFIFTQAHSKKTHQRLKAVLQAKDGFSLAEKDLQIRGPGQFFGYQQSGLPDLAMESLANPRLIYQARQTAQKLLGQDAQLKKHPLLREKLAQFRKTVHLE